MTLLTKHAMMVPFRVLLLQFSHLTLNKYHPSQNAKPKSIDGDDLRRYTISTSTTTYKSASHSNEMNTMELTKSLKSTLATLDIQRKSLELEAEAITSELTTSPAPDVPPIGIDTPLVDRDGYPRGDVDVHRARELRHRLACIRTDHSELMRNIEVQLLKLNVLMSSSKKNSVEEEQKELAKREATKPKPKFDPVSGKWVVMNWDGSVAGVPNGEARNFHDLEGKQQEIENKKKDNIVQHISDATKTMTVDDTVPTTTAQQIDRIDSIDDHDDAKPLVPFAVVNSVDLDSPAEAAGITEGDLICIFGSAHYENHRQLRAIAEMVPQAAAAAGGIPITVLRRRKMSVEDDVSHSVEAGEHVRKRLKIYPRPWKGRGLIGCHIVGYDPAEYKEPHY